MFITSSFTVAQTGSNPNGYQQGMNLNKLLLHTPDYYSSNVKEQATNTDGNASQTLCQARESKHRKGTPYDSIYMSSRIKLIYSGIFQKSDVEIQQRN